MQDLDYGLLVKFIVTASNHTYAAGSRFEESPERAGFKELVYQEADFHYRDSFAGYHRSWGTELVRFRNVPVWTAGYGGGMQAGRESLSRECFKFLRTCLKSDMVDGAPTFRGPRYLRLGDWRYYYEQQGDFRSFTGQEKITYQKETVFIHTALGGLVINKEKI